MKKSKDKEGREERKARKRGIKRENEIRKMTKQKEEHETERK
jgi:hypothetical protein